MTTAELLDSAIRVATGAPTLRAVIYARVSSDPHNRGKSVADQVAECKRECEQRGWHVVEIFDGDNDRSASRYATKERKDYARLVEFLRAGNADVLVTWESSRAQRDLEAYLRLREIAEGNGVQWCYKGRLYDLSRTDDRFTTGLDALLAEREASEIRDRVLRGQRASAEKGLPTASTLFGYEREYHPKTKEFVRQLIREDQAAIVREAAERIAAGEAKTAVIRDFNRRGIRTSQGAVWRHRNLQIMLTNPAYIGKRVHRGKVIGDGVWPAILEPDVFYACVQRYANPDPRFNISGHVRHLLSGIPRCGVCGGRIKAFSSNTGHYYTCWGTTGAVGAGRAKCVNLHRSTFEKHVTALVLERLSRPDAAELFADEERADTAREAMAEAAEKRARLDEIYDSVAEGKLSPKALERIESKLLPEIAAAEERAAAASVAPALRGVVRPDIAEIWPTLPLGQQREIITALMDITLMPNTGRRRDTRRIKVGWKHDL
jgi:DNA invertase Pin-like site-specific DNA recombinase